MLISLSREFVFIATPKTASTAIENYLRDFAEISLTRTPWGKHMSLADVETRFGWLRSRMPRMRPYVFGVIRDPVDYVLSIYNSHRKPAFADLPQYTGNVTFNAFWHTFSRGPNQWLLQPQISRFLHSDGRMGADCLIDYARLDAVWPFLCQRLDVPETTLALANPSPKHARREDVADDVTEAIYRHYADDVDALRKYAGGSSGLPDMPPVAFGEAVSPPAGPPG